MVSAQTTVWIRDQVMPLVTIDPATALTDLAPLRDMVADAQVVGLGESAHGAHEHFVIKHRIVRMLVEEMGFRCVALEEDWTKGVQVDAHVVAGTGEAQALLADAGPPWRTEEILRLVTWLRSYNQEHPDDKVRFAGVDVVAVRPLAYQAVSEYVERAAPERAGELEQHLAAIRPRGGVEQHIGWLYGQPDKQPLVDHARAVYDLVAGLPQSDGHALAVQHAKAIAGFYRYHATHSVPFRDQQMADTIAWWRDQTGDKIIYWAANVHTADAPRLTISYPPFPPSEGRSAGAHLRERYGRSYYSLGMTFHHGTVNVGWNPPEPQQVPPPPTEFAERALGEGGRLFLLDLRASAPDPVRSWLDAPATVRMIGPSYDSEKDADYHMTGGSLAEWFDAVIQIEEVTPTRLLAAPDEG